MRHTQTVHAVCTDPTVVQLPSQMLTRLNLETRSLHAVSDAVWVDLLAGPVTLEQYKGALVATYGFEAPIEAVVALTPGVNAALPLRPRARSGLLVQDLLTLGLFPAAIARLPQCCQIVPFRSVVEALGWIYVVERVTLLHDSVRRQLQAAMPSVHAWSYLGPYGGHTGMRWQELGHALDVVAHTDDLEEQIVAAARDAFATQRRWLATETTYPVRG